MENDDLKFIYANAGGGLVYNKGRLQFPISPENVSSAFICHALISTGLSDEAFAQALGVSVETVKSWKFGSEFVQSIQKHAIYYYFKYLSIS